MAISDGDRRLRVAQILCWIPGMAMLIATSVVAHHVYFAMLVIPMTLTAIVALSLLHPKACQRPFITFLDFVLTLVHIGMIIPYIVGVRRGWGWRMYRDTGANMLACYASFWPLIVLVIHAYFIIRTKFPDLSELWRKMMGCATCPHCQRQLVTDPRLLWDMTPNGSSGSSKNSNENTEGYVKVHAVAEYREEESLPRPSTDDEAARLV